jgi:hypothetical protein
MAHRFPRYAPALVALLALSACGGDSPVQPGPSDAPVVTSVTPDAGPTEGGTALTIRGARFAVGAAVTLGGRPATDVSVQSAEVITATSPAGLAAGAADVVVSVGGKNGSLPGGFTYLVAPDNEPPVIASVTARGSRPREPANFADLGESLTVTATVTDEETEPEDLEYQWSATLGVFTGSGSRVTWRAPSSADTPVNVTITLRVIERYGSNDAFRHEVTRTRVVSLHDSIAEVGDMARRFLVEFSKPQTNKDWRDIMADFDLAGNTCPNPSLIDGEREDVIEHYTYYVMHHYSVGAATVTVRFDSECSVPGRSSRAGDACASVPVMWDSTDTRTDNRGVTSGIDYISAAYSSSARRWRLCSSDFRATSTFRHSLYDR